MLMPIIFTLVVNVDKCEEAQRDVRYCLFTCPSKYTLEQCKKIYCKKEIKKADEACEGEDK